MKNDKNDTLGGYLIQACIQTSSFVRSQDSNSASTREAQGREEGLMKREEGREADTES